MSTDTGITDLTDLTEPSHDTDDTAAPVTIGEPVAAAEQLVEVRRRPGPAAVLGAGASLVAVAYLARAAGGGTPLDWVLAVVLGVLGVVNLTALLDARSPLLVADALGVRLRLGRTWVGLPWEGLQAVEHRARRGWWRDGQLTVRTHYVQRVLEDLDPRARRVARLNRRLHHAPLAVPLGLGTRVTGAEPDLTTALRALAGRRAEVLESSPVEQGTVLPQDLGDDLALGEAPVEALDERPRRPRLPDLRPALARLIGALAARFERGERTDEEEQPDPAELGDLGDEPQEPEVRASQTPAPARETVAAARAEVRREVEPRASAAELEEETQVWGEWHAFVDDGADGADGADEAHDGHLMLIDDHVAQPAADPVIGPQFAAARQRLGLSVDELADRTRIRPHVIEAIEVDDFSACGGDFYARGHLRTLGRVLGVEAAPILTTYDERYSDAPIDPRRVFEAELAGAVSIRATRGGPTWSVLVAAVMALILCWSVARLLTGGSGQGPDEAVLSGSGGPNHSHAAAAPPVPVTLTAAGGGARVVVRDGTGRLVFSGDLAFGQKHTVQAAPPVRVQSTDGSVTVTVRGQDRGRMGPAGRPATRSYVAPR